MDLVNIPAENARNEADVEQKVLWPLLTNQSFLGVPPRAILTKPSLGSLSFVAKATLPKNYIPDYILFFESFPVCVIEAKGPDVSVQTAIAEARVYADILNKQFPSRLNPVDVVIGCNGREFAVGPVDANTSTTFLVSDLLIGSKKLAELKALVGVERLSLRGEGLRNKTRRQNTVRPIRFLDGQMFLERVKPNEIASTLNPIYEMFFRAEEPEKIRLILDTAYVDTAELREYDQVLHGLLKQVERALPDDYKTILTDKRQEYTLTPEIGRYEGDIAPGGRMHLIIGSRGSGKSLFIARFFEHLMPDNLKKSAVWCVIDFNKAKSSVDNLEEYICERFIETAQNLQFDPHSLDGLHHVFSVEVQRLNKVLSGLPDEAERQRTLTLELLKLSNDKVAFAKGLSRFMTGDLRRPLIVAFDNVDRLESGQQLRIFQAAQWFRTETRAFALLTLRDVTFERFKDQPPLDAFAQISNFYIRPPRFALVLQKRLKLAIDQGLKDTKWVEQSTLGGLKVRYSREQLGMFLQTVYDALFVGGLQVGRIVDALAERDVREALGMFTRMLSSGHFNADRIISIGLGSGAEIKHDMLLKVLMRADYRLYTEDAGFVRNLFALPEGASGNVFLTAEILGFFGQPDAGTGSSGGLKRFDALISDLTSMGFGEGEVRERTHQLIKFKMLAYDGEDTEAPVDDDLIKLTPSGAIHLHSLPQFIEYLSSVAIHTQIEDTAVARRIAEEWQNAKRYADLSFARKHAAASMLAEYLVRHKNRLDQQNPIFAKRSREAERLVAIATHAVNLTAAAATRSRNRGASTTSQPAAPVRQAKVQPKRS